MKYIITKEYPTCIKELIPFNNYYMFVVAKHENDDVGCLVFDINDDIFQIRHIYVLEEFRSQGIGTELINTAIEFTHKNSLIGIMIATEIPKNIRLPFEKFLYKNNFQIPEYDGSLFIIDIDNMPNTYLYSLPVSSDNFETRLNNINHLSVDLNYDYTNNIRPNIESAYLIENINGNIIPELSFALEKNDKISAYIIYSEYMDELYLAACYVSRFTPTELIRLLKYTFKNIETEYNEYKRLKIKLLNFQGKHLFSGLIKGIDFEEHLLLTSYILL